MKFDPTTMKLVKCSMNTCYFYIPTSTSSSGFAYCKHPDKDIVRSGGPCPLFRLDWQKQLKNINLKKG